MPPAAGLCGVLRARPPHHLPLPRPLPLLLRSRCFLRQDLEIRPPRSLCFPNRPIQRPLAWQERRPAPLHRQRGPLGRRVAARPSPRRLPSRARVGLFPPLSPAQLLLRLLRLPRHAAAALRRAPPLPSRAAVPLRAPLP